MNKYESKMYIPKFFYLPKLILGAVEIHPTEVYLLENPNFECFDTMHRKEPSNEAFLESHKMKGLSDLLEILSSQKLEEYSLVTFITEKDKNINKFKSATIISGDSGIIEKKLDKVRKIISNSIDDKIRKIDLQNLSAYLSQAFLFSHYTRDDVQNSKECNQLIYGFIGDEPIEIKLCCGDKAKKLDLMKKIKQQKDMQEQGYIIAEGTKCQELLCDKDLAVLGTGKDDFFNRFGLEYNVKCLKCTQPLSSKPKGHPGHYFCKQCWIYLQQYNLHKVIKSSSIDFKIQRIKCPIPYCQISYCGSYIFKNLEEKEIETIFNVVTRKSGIPGFYKNEILEWKKNLDTPEAEKFECVSCHQNFEEQHLILCTAFPTHYTCRHCLKGMIKHADDEGKGFSYVKCKSLGCDKQFQSQNLEEICDEITIGLYSSMLSRT